MRKTAAFHFDLKSELKPRPLPSAERYTGRNQILTVNDSQSVQLLGHDDNLTQRLIEIKTASLKRSYAASQAVRGFY
jgi:hypothetical protein